MYILGDKINEIMNPESVHYHPEVTFEDFKKIPKILNDPILVLKSNNSGRQGQENTRIVLFGGYKDQNGNPFMLTLDLKDRGRRPAMFDLQKVNSMYVKSYDPANFVRGSYVLYADKKRTTRLLDTLGFNDAHQPRRSGSIGTISYSRDNVKIYGVRFRDFYGDENNSLSTREDVDGKASEGRESTVSVRWARKYV